jgi:transposase
MLSAANVHDSMVFEELIDAIEPIKRPRGRPRKRPNKLLAAKAYDDKKCKGVLRKRRIKNRIARKGIESTEKLGRHRWIVERTLGWLSKYRRLTIRYERREDIHEAFLHLGCSLICLNYSTRWVLKGSLKNRLPLPQLRVCGQGLLRVAQACKSRIDNGFPVPCLAHCCRPLRPG